MAKLNTRMQVDVRAAERVQTLIHLLNKYLSDLPDELRQSLLELADCDACEFGLDEFAKAGGIVGQAETDFHTTEIISANPILKRVTYATGSDKTWAKHTEYPEKFRLGCNGAVFVQWGY